MRLLLAALAATVAVGCSSSAAPEKDEGDTASLIVGGTTASIDAWPGMAQLETAEGVQCGGTLISSEWVVTAAHCFMDNQANGSWTQVAFGRQNSNSGGGEIIQVKEAFRHTQYDGATMRNDIALIHLTSKTTRKPAKVMSATDWTSLAKAGTNVTVVGWGATTEGAAMTAALRQVTIPLVDHNACAGMELGGATLGDKMICAGLANGGKDACQGDSGGPLFMTVGGAPVQVGIVSFGEGCARANAPGVYTQIAGYVDWINQNTNNALGTAPAPTNTTPGTTEGGDETGDVVSGGDDDDSTSVGSDSSKDDDSAEETAKPAKKKRRSPVSAANAGGCAMSTHSTTSASSALLVVAAILAMRRRRRVRH